MGTRTAIFKEQEDGNYKGIYVALDGYIESTGIALIEHYQDPKKIQKLIDLGLPLHSIGAEPLVIEIFKNNEFYKAYSEDLNNLDTLGFDGQLPYSPTYITVRKDKPFEGEKYYAHDLDEIKNFEYLTLNHNGEIQGLNDDDGLPYRGSDNNGYLYAQKQDGTWLVSTSQKSGEMTEFTSLEPKVKEILTEHELSISSERVLQNSAVIKLNQEYHQEKYKNIEQEVAPEEDYEL